MILENVDQLKNKNYELIIFGSGPAGMSIALDFQKLEKKVLIVEAGDVLFSEYSQDFYKSKIIGEDYGDTSITRLRQVGGTSGHWAGVCRPLDKHDFGKWPIKKIELDNFLQKACDYLQIKNEFNTRAFNNSFDQISYQKSDVMYVNFLPKIKLSTKIDIITNLSLIDFKFSEDKIDKAIVYNKKTNQKINLKSNLYILACGTIENNRIMLNLKNKYSKYFPNEMPLGKYYMDHPVSSIATSVIEKRKFKQYFKFDKLGKNIEGDYLSVSLSPNSNFIKTNEILSTELMLTLGRYEKNPILNKNLENLKKIAPNLSQKLKKSLIKKEYFAATFECSPEQDSTVSNKIELDRENKDKFGIPRVKIFWKKSELMRKTLRLCLEDLGRFFADNDIGRIGIYDFIYNNQLYTNEPGIHHLGGTRIGENKNNSVVDKNLKFHSLKNLYITGGSVFRTSGHANPTLSIVQLSLRLSDHLKKRLV